MISVAKGPFKNDVTGVQGRGYAKLVTKREIEGVYVFSDITIKNICLRISFYFYLFLVSAAANESGAEDFDKMEDARSSQTDHV